MERELANEPLKCWRQMSADLLQVLSITALVSRPLRDVR
jgi:hypothetical protein